MKDVMPDSNAAASQLTTVRDFLRWALSEFRRAKVVHGHGTVSAMDEAAFLILETLRLPVDDINPWLDATLLTCEREALANIIRARIETRMPAAYLARRAYIGGMSFYVDERVIVPRSYIGELMLSGIFGGDEAPLIEDVTQVTGVLDLCTGSGCLAILAALVFPHARIDAIDLSAGALALARRNVASHRLGDRIALHRGDLFQPLGTDRYDLILSNPPYVDARGMAKLPPEFRHEPRLALAAGDDGLDLVRRILAEAPRHLTPKGGLLCEIGRGRKPLEAAYPRLPFLWLDTEQSQGEVFWISRSDLLAG